jgi:hypothetical protein
MDLPDDLLREMKLRAVHEGRKLKDVAAAAIRSGLGLKELPLERAVRQRVKLPLFQCAADAPAARMTAAELIALEQKALLEEDMRRVDLAL